MCKHVGQQVLIWIINRDHFEDLQFYFKKQVFKNKTQSWEMKNASSVFIGTSCKS